MSEAQKKRILDSLIRNRVTKYSELPESEKIPLRVSLAKEIYLHDLKNGTPLPVLERSMSRLVEREQYSGAAGIMQAIKEFSAC